jgi:hypothetical protein
MSALTPVILPFRHIWRMGWLVSWQGLHAWQVSRLVALQVSVPPSCSFLPLLRFVLLLYTARPRKAGWASQNPENFGP